MTLFIDHSKNVYADAMFYYVWPVLVIKVPTANLLLTLVWFRLDQKHVWVRLDSARIDTWGSCCGIQELHSSCRWEMSVISASQAPRFWRTLGRISGRQRRERINQHASSAEHQPHATGFDSVIWNELPALASTMTFSNSNCSSPRLQSTDRFVQFIEIQGLSAANAMRTSYMQ